MLFRPVICLALVAALVIVGPQPVFAQSADAETVAYTFKNGDTLIAVADRYLVSIESAQSVQRTNNIKDATKIRPGTVLIIPTSLLKGTPIGAKVVAFSGSVTIGGKKESIAPKVGSEIVEGQTLSTGAPGFLTIAIAGGSNVSIPSRSRVKIVRLRKYILTGGSDIDLFVEQGRAETSAAPIKDKKSRFRMRTPTAVSAVRGTVFRVGYDGPGSSSLTEVVEGAVAVDTGKSATPALVPTGFGAVLPVTGSLLQEELLPAPQVVNAGAIQAESAVSFTLSPIAGAKGYHTQVARDAGFLEIFAETISPGPLARFDTMADGTFFVRSMAIADSGLEGLADNFAFRRRLTTIAAAKSGETDGSGFRINWVNQGTGKSVYRFQLFDEANPQIPLVDELGLETSGISLTNLPAGAYRWRVKMSQTSNDGTVEVWSVPQSFVIGK